MEKLLDKKAFKKVKGPYDASLTYYVLIDKTGKETKISLTQINDNKKFYLYSSGDIFYYIYDIGVQKGAIKTKINRN